MDASKVKYHFDQIKKRGGSAAIDFHKGVLVLMCTMPSFSIPESWGRGSVPAPVSNSSVRIVECRNGEFV